VPDGQPRVLNVNDDELRRYIIDRMLRHGAFAVIDAATGREALELARAERPDLVLLDVKLPDLDGFEICRRIKASPETNRTTVVMVSAVLTEAADQVKGLEAGADGYLTEPLDPGVMVATLRALLRARRAEVEVRESREVLSRVIDAATTLITAVDADGRIVLFNPACEALTGYRRHEVLGRPLLEMFVPDPWRAAVAARFAETSPEALASPHVNPWRTRAGEERLIEWRCFNVADADGGVVTVGIGNDVTLARRADARRATQFAVTAILAESPTVEVAIPSLLRALCEGTGWDVGELWRVDRGTLRLAGFWQSPALAGLALESHVRALAFTRGQSLVGKVWDTARAAWSRDVTADPVFGDVAFARAGDLRAALAFPVPTGSDVTGVMALFSRTASAPDADLMRMMADLGAQIGQFVERRRAEEALQLSEARYRLVARATKDAIRDVDLASGRLDWNEAVESLFGYRPTEIESVAEWEARLHPDDRDAIVSAVREAITAGREVWSGDYRFRTASGQYVFVSDRGYIERGAGGHPLRMIAAMQDVTERRVREERDRLRALSLGILRAREEEARRIARELHDEAGQLLASVHLALSRLRRDLGPDDERPLDEIARLLDRTEEHLRGLAHDLRPTVLDDLGLAPALDVLARRVSARSGVDVRVDSTLAERLPPLVETALYRIVQEALTNVTRHAQARRVTVALGLAQGGGGHGPAARERRVRCAVRDDGVGFSIRSGTTNGGKGLGLIGIRERVDGLHGTLEITSAPGRGTEMRVDLPLDTNDDASPPR
jgi:PAS domain S-box-containing protein